MYDTNPRNKTVFILSAIVMVLLAGLVISLLTFSGNKHKVEVTTDSPGAILELNDGKYTLEKEFQSIDLEANSYNYRATAEVEGKKVVLEGSFDLIENDSASLSLFFKIFTEEEISKVLCQGEEDCLFAPEFLKTKYLEDNTWAVVSINNPALENAVAVLKIGETGWSIIDGPGTDILNEGRYPESVEEAIKNAQ